MLEADGVSPLTSHTTNLVPLILSEKRLKLREHGGLSDLAPTALALLGFAQPLQMEGRNLLVDD
jgi:2,3-bisphosphoglycerate-independent phosphoglycerate mutase